MDNISSNLDQDKAEVSPTSKIWNPAFNEFKLGDSPHTVSSYLPRQLMPDWLSLPQAYEYRHDVVKYFWLHLTQFGDQITKFIPPNVSVTESSYICFLFFNQKLFHISIRFFHDATHQNYDEIVEAYARAVNTPIVKRENKSEFYYDDTRIIYFSCFHPDRSQTCMDVILKDQTTSTDGHWYNLRTFHEEVPQSFIQPILSPQPYEYDIMISYCHKDKEICHNIYNHLCDQKYRVWIDLENMYGPIVEKMAYAIENAQIVLLCMSDAYKSSAYCRLEAEYAFKFQTIIIPLVVKKDFTQTGWLGMLCGLRLHIDFTKTTFDEAFGKLWTQILQYRAETRKKSRVSTNVEHEEEHKSKERDQTYTLFQVKSTKESQLYDRRSSSRVLELNNQKIVQQNNITSGYIFSITDEECRTGFFSLQYDPVFDRYYRNEIEQEKTLGWANGVYSCSNIQRKIEQDWQMVYLCRRKQGENLSTGSISWLIQLNKELEMKYQFDRINIQCSSTTFHELASIQWQLCIGEKKTIDIPEESNKSFEYCIDEEDSCFEHLQLRVVATLTSGNDDNDDHAFQNAQILRQSIKHPSQDGQSHCLKINATIIDRQSYYF